ncbi:MAG TPA: hypothetical protein VEU62_01175 [Bryobacterales bacterium]|nr:hypothetical protein [Bryobacterales bacterium]
MAADVEAQKAPEGTPEPQQTTTNLVLTLSDGTKVKRRVLRQRACNELGEKGKICAGHLKRWYHFGDEVKQAFSDHAEIYRCEHCHTLYLPNESERPRTLIQSY